MESVGITLASDYVVCRYEFLLHKLSTDMLSALRLQRRIVHVQNVIPSLQYFTCFVNSHRLQATCGISSSFSRYISEAMARKLRLMF